MINLFTDWIICNRMISLNKRRWNSSNASTINNTIDRKTLLPLNIRYKGNLEKVDRVNLPKVVESGLLGYKVLLLIENINYDTIENHFDDIRGMLNSLDGKSIYTMLVSALPSDKGEARQIFSHSLLIHKDTSLIELIYLLKNTLGLYEMKYDSDDAYSLAITGKIWYSHKDINNMVLAEEKLKLGKERANVILRDLNKANKVGRKLLQRLEKSTDQIYSSLSPNSIDNLNFVYGDFDFSTYLLKDNLEGSKLVEFIRLNHKKYFILDKNGEVSHSWTDYYNGGVVTRIVKKLSMNIVFKNNKTIIDVKYYFPKIQESSGDWINTHLIGVIDLETCRTDEGGTQTVYAGGWYGGKETKLYYLTDYTSSDDLVFHLFKDIFESKYHNYTFYVHNLSHFDSIFIMSALSKYGVRMKPVMRDDNSLVSLSILWSDKTKSGKTINKKLVVLDSNLMLNSSLRDLAIHFKCDTLKGYFSYSFVDLSKIDYIGSIPDIKYFPDISIEEYNKLKLDKHQYSVKSETLIYLKGDLLCLYQVMVKFAKLVYNDFGLCITNTKTKTISSLSLKVYLTNYYKNQFNIHSIKGSIANEIRNGYFGGLVHVSSESRHITQGYFYDMNSQYPSAMLHDLPVGNPVLTNSDDLDSFFGFCYAHITPPSGLHHYILPFRENIGEVTLPDTPFTGLYFSEELKDIQKYGYTVVIEGGFKFDRGVGIFKDFVNDLYLKRLNAKEVGNYPLQLTLKLLLNSLYGRTGMKEIENRSIIVNDIEAKYILEKKNVTMISKLGNMNLIKYNDNIDFQLLKLLDMNTEIDPKLNSLAGLFKQTGVFSSIPIAAAITAYARMSMNQFKNMKDNICYYSDTDSTLMQYPLPEDLVSPSQLGKMKLEHIVKEGYFISPKLYAIITDTGQCIIKSKGVHKGVLTFEDFKSLADGNNITIRNTVFLRNLPKGTVNITPQDYILKGYRDS